MQKEWFLMAAVALAATGTMADDWYTWRGPAANGISAEKGLNPDNLKKRWKKELGKGHASVSVKGARLFTMGNKGNEDIVYCLNTKDGKTIWSYSYDCKDGSYPGPRSTPALEEGKLYTLSRNGQLHCLDADSGKVLWDINVLDKTSLKNIRWGLASSPVIEGDLLLLNVGNAGVAVNKSNGKIAWQSEEGLGSYASVVPFSFKGQRLAAVFSAKGLVIVEVDSGKQIDFYEWETKYDVHGADPLIIGEQIFITSGYNHGCALLDFSSGKLQNVWENNALKAQFSSCIYFDGYIYGVDGQTGKDGRLICIDAQSGEEQWSEEIGFGSLMMADGKLIVLAEDDTLYIVQATPKKFESLAKKSTGIGKLCWTAPVFSNGTIYCRNTEGTLVALDAGK